MTDEGHFPRGRSLLRHVHEQRAVGLMYGQRALCIGAVKPLNYVGTSEHTRPAHKQMPFKRITHTARMFEIVFFGSRAEADEVLARVHGMHDRVRGELLADAGPHHPAGTPYSAFDPELMLWTVAVIADSAQWFYERLVRPLSEEQRESLWRDYVRFAELFGTPRSAIPPSYAEFREWYAAQLAGPDLFLTEEARYMGHASAFQIPMATLRQPAKRMHDLVMLGSLPPRVRELYGLRYTPAHAAGCATLLAAARAARPLLPARLRRGSCIRDFDAVAAVERRRIERGKPTPQIV
ncbi:MAG TPA: oxygenase MpaB family protein [Solirubrobacteraceae bacterium]|nr:oxygenase MpaB family protein [Solirubrobacteraceae bacterium]